MEPAKELSVAVIESEKGRGDKNKMCYIICEYYVIRDGEWKRKMHT